MGGGQALSNVPDQDATLGTGSFPEMFEKAVKGQPSVEFCENLVVQDEEFLTTLLVLLGATGSLGGMSGMRGGGVSRRAERDFL
jgi:hypothetical protein